MSKTWKSTLETDPLPALLAWQDPALTYFVRRGLLEEPVGGWFVGHLPGVKTISREEVILCPLNQ